MKKLLLSFLLVSNLSFGQEAAYQLNGIASSYYDYFLSLNNGIYYANICTDNVDYSLSCAISYLPNNGQIGWKKMIDFPENFIPQKTTIIPCNLSNNLIVSVQSTYCDFCFIMKIDTDGNIIWSKMLSYTDAIGDYGSNATPLSLNAQDEITIALTSNNLVLSKLDTNGNLIFSKSIQSLAAMDGKNPGFAAISTSDGGYLITMKSGSNPTITKLNSNLQVSWSKKWSIDSYSHPKLANILPNGNYCIIGEGDHGTYIAQVDPTGNLLSYKYGVSINYPYQCKVFNSDSIQLIGTGGSDLRINLSNNTTSLKTFDNLIDAWPINYIDGKMNFLNQVNSSIYLDIENTQMGCLTSTTSHPELSELSIYPSSVVNETVTIGNNGSLTNYSPTTSTTNNVSMTLTCGSLGMDETTKTSLKTYPNPSINGQMVTVELEKSSGTKLQILTLSGKLVDSYEVNASVEKVIFKAPGQSGMYFVQVLDATGNVLAVEKLIVE